MHTTRKRQSTAQAQHRRNSNSHLLFRETNIKPMGSLILKLDTEVPASNPLPYHSKSTQPAMATSLAIPDMNASRGKEAKGGLQNHIPKVKVPPRFKVGDTIMTMEGAAIVHVMGKKGIIQVAWPKHHSVSPTAIYTKTIPVEDVWTQA
jgi:hypothetical protein